MHMVWRINSKAPKLPFSFKDSPKQIPELHGGETAYASIRVGIFAAVGCFQQFSLTPCRGCSPEFRWSRISRGFSGGRGSCQAKNNGGRPPGSHGLNDAWLGRSLALPDHTTKRNLRLIAPSPRLNSIYEIDTQGMSSVRSEIRLRGPSNSA